MSVYSESHWRNQCAPIIAKVIAEHVGEDESAVRLALREVYPFGERKYHPYRIYLDEIARQLGHKPKLGARCHKGRPTPSDPDPRQDGLFPAAVAGSREGKP